MNDVNKSFPEKIIKQLRNRYLQLIKNEDSGSFFLELAHYVKYIKEKPELNEIIKNCNKNEEKENIKQLIKITENFKKKVLAMTAQIIAFKNIKNVEMEAISEVIDDLSSTIKNCDHINKWFPEYLGTDIYMSLYKIFEFLYKGYTLYEDFLDFTNSKYYFREIEVLFESLMEVRSKFEDLRRKTVWGAWNHIEAFYISVFKRNEILNNYFKEKNFASLLLNEEDAKFFFSKREIEDINKILKNNETDQEKTLLLKYKTYLKLISGQIFEYIDSLSLEKIECTKINYDENNCVLNFYGKKIEFRQSSRQTALLKLVFNNKGEFNAIERRDLMEEIGVVDENETQIDKHTQNKYRLVLFNAARGINNKISKILKIDDFLIGKTIGVKINSKYYKDVF